MHSCRNGNGTGTKEMMLDDRHFRTITQNCYDADSRIKEMDKTGR